MEIWVALAPPAVAVGSAAALHRRPRSIYWSVCCLLTSIITALFYLGRRASGAPSNAGVAVEILFIAVPMLATFGVERLWLNLGEAVSRRLTTTVLSAPLGILIYAFSAFVALIVGVNIGVLEP